MSKALNLAATAVVFGLFAAGTYHAGPKDSALTQDYRAQAARMSQDDRIRAICADARSGLMSRLCERLIAKSNLKNS